MQPIVETWELNPDDKKFQPTPEEVDAHLRCCYADKKTPTEEQRKLAETVTEDCQRLSAACKRKKKLCGHAKRGFRWYARIVDGETNEILFESPNAYGKRMFADRHGQRIVARWRKTGKFEKSSEGTFSVPLVNNGH